MGKRRSLEPTMLLPLMVAVSGLMLTADVPAAGSATPPMHPSKPNIVIILGLGTLYLYFWTGIVTGGTPGLYAVLAMGALPFIPGAVVKTLLAVFIGAAIMPKERVRS